MKELARISLTMSDGKPVGVPAVLIGTVEYASSDGALITLYNGRELKVQDSVSEVEAKIDVLWDELITALSG
jgi:uncharacterized protein YlzI (FlbEa/FlbD family)